MKRLILIMSLTIMLFPAVLLAQESVPDAPQRPAVRAANTARVRQIDMRARELEEQAKNLERRENELRERAENLERRDREFDERAKDLEMREMEMNNSRRESENQLYEAEFDFRTRQQELELEERRLEQELELEERRIEIENNNKENNKEMQPLLLLILVVNILCAVWVYQDIQKRSHESGIWIVIALISGLLGTLVYAIVRLGNNVKSKA